MNEVTRSVAEIEPADRRALEHVFGLPLRDDQQVVVRVESRSVSEEPTANGDQEAADDTILPDWCNVYDGLSDDEIAAIEKVMLPRADLTRASE
ncbi:MAG TPA: hypothetical protein VGY55_07440 [Pirellulales bacterium]|jgi:hypothetical protein|nr:hypothetical protein [Pirellulales bacterium]